MKILPLYFNRNNPHLRSQWNLEFLTTVLGSFYALQLDGTHEVKGLHQEPEVSVTVCFRWSCQDQDKRQSKALLKPL